MIDFWRAMRWLVPGWPVQKLSQLPRLLRLPADLALRDAEIKAGRHPEYAALLRLFDPNHNLVTVLTAGRVQGDDAASRAANELMARARALARRETFFHWWTSFPTVFGAGSKNGFDAVIGNPPWDMLQMQEVEWFSERVMAIAAQTRAADRKRLIAELPKTNPTVWAQFQAASTRADQEQFVVRTSDDYPLLGEGRSNLYKLFVERAQALVAPDGLVALVTPSGIAADKGAAEFFRSLSGTGRLGALFDFENHRVFFPDVDSRFKFCTLVFGGLTRTFAQTRCAFYLHSLDELDEPTRVLTLTAENFASVNPNTGAAPIFRSQRDADITLKVYAKHPVLVKHGEVSASTGKQPDEKAWPVKFYQGMFNMTSDSRFFINQSELKKLGFKPAALNRWTKGDVSALPLYEGKMVQMYDHRAADVVVNAANLMRAAQQESISQVEKASPKRYPAPQYWVKSSDLGLLNGLDYCLAFKDVTAPTNMRTMIAAMVPAGGFGNTLPMLLPADEQARTDYARTASLLLANLGSFAFDFVARQKVQGQHLNWFVVEQLPVIAPERFNEPLPAAFAKAMRAAKLMNGHHPHPTVVDFVVPQVLVLSYTAHDMAPFARDLGYVDAAGQALAPFVWDEERRRVRLAALDALFFYLYGLNASEAAHILASFPIVREQDQQAFGRYRTEDDILQFLSLLAPTYEKT